MQDHARVCEENKLEKKRLLRTPIKTILHEFEGSYKKSGEAYQDDILEDDSL